MELWNSIASLLKDEEGKIPVKDIATGLVIGADAAATYSLARKIEKYHSQTEKRIRDIYQFLGEVEDKAKLSETELSRLKLLVNDLMNEVNDKTLASLMENVPEEEKVRIVDYFLSLKKSYHIVLATVMVELNRVLQEAGEEIQEDLVSLRIAIDEDARKVHESHSGLVSIMSDLKDDVAKLQLLLSDVEDMNRIIKSSKKELEGLADSTETVIANVRQANKELSQAKSSAIVLLLLGAFIGFLANLVANSVSVPTPLTEIVLTLTVILFLVWWIKTKRAEIQY